MGVKKSSKPFGIIILMFLWVIVPFVIVMAISSGKFSSPKKDVSAAQEEALATEENTGDSSNANDANDADVNLLDYTVKNDGSYSRAYTKNSKGLYELSGPVMDVAKVLSEEEYYDLNSFLWNLSDTTGAQVVVFTVPSLDGIAIETFSISHASYWELGQKGVDNGVLLTVAMEEHEVRIETGYGAEGSLTDAKCARIIRNVIAPSFRQENYGEGIVEAVHNIAGILQDDPSLVTISESDTDNTGAVAGIAIFMCIFIMIIVFAIISSKNAKLSPGGVRYVPTSTFTNSSSSFSSGSSFTSFHGGGGSFGGGGASGRW